MSASEEGATPNQTPPTPDCLDEQPVTPSRRRRIMLIAMVAVVCAGLGLVRISQLEPDLTPPGPPLPSGSSAPAGGTPPKGILFFASSGWVWTLDLGSDALLRTTMTIDEAGSMVPIGHGVAVMPAESGAAGLFVDGFNLYPTPKFLAKAEHLVPAAGDSVWVASVRSSARAVEWRRTSSAGQVDAKVHATGVVVSDGAGGLLRADNQVVERIYPLSAGPRVHGTVVATGPDGYLVQPCTRSTCTSELALYSPGDARPTLPGYSLPHVLDIGALSPNNQFFAVAVQATDGEVHLDVRAVQDGRVLRSFPHAGDGQVVWLDRTRVAFTSQGKLQLYDSTTDVVTPLAPAMTGVGSPLIWQLS